MPLNTSPGAQYIAQILWCNVFCRQRMVYKAIWLELQDTVHAVDAMTTKTPAEATA